MVGARRLTRPATRRARREFLAEGPQAVREALLVVGCVRELFVSGPAEQAHADLVDSATAADVPVHRCEERAVAALSSSVTPQGVVAVCGFLDLDLAEAVPPPAEQQRGGLVAVGAALRDPGNAGALIRCADAAGATAVVLTDCTVDVYNGKVVRASAGSLFHLPVVVGATLPEAAEHLRRGGWTLLAADGSAHEKLPDLDTSVLAGRVAWVFGNEARGLAEAELGRCDRRVAVPLYGRAESLNVASAAAVCLFATAFVQRSSRSRSVG